MSEDPVSESEILIRLSQANELLMRSQQLKVEVFSLWRFRVRLKVVRKTHDDCDGLEIAQTRPLDREDKNSFGLKFLLGLLKSSNQVVAHAAIKTVGALSDFIRLSKRNVWPSFLLALWRDVECWVACPDPSSLGDFQIYGTLVTHANINKELKTSTPAYDDACFLAAARTLEALHQGLKESLKVSDQNLEKGTSSKQNREDLEAFLCLLTSRVRDVATVICLGKEEKHVDDHMRKPHTVRISQGVEREVLLGTLLRLLCTAARVPLLLTNAQSLGDISHRSYLDMVQALIPVVSSASLQVHHDCQRKSCVSHFLRHKMLGPKFIRLNNLINMVASLEAFMLRLSDWFKIKPSLASACFQALSSHGADLLEINIQVSNKETKTLDESPFVAALDTSSTKNPATSSVRHLERRALLLLFKIAYAANQSTEVDLESAVGEHGMIGGGKRSREQVTLKCICELTPRVYLRDWIKRQYKVGACGLSDGNPCSIGVFTIQNQLATSFVQLYLDEDDLLLMMMTQLLDVPFVPSILMCQEHPLDDASCRIAATAFVPSRMIHTFFTSIHHDYLTITKLLVSKTSGVMCLSLLLRVLRYITYSWPDFVDICPWSSPEDHNTKPGHELGECKMKSLLGGCGLNTHDDECSRSEILLGEGRNGKHLKFRGTELDRSDCDCMSSVRRTKGPHHPHHLVTKAGEFLLQLKVHIEYLEEQSLFPYKATTLLNR